MEIPLRPLGKKDIHQLESILLVATILRPEVLQLIKNPEERLTWVDSLAVAAAAIAREKAGMTISQIVDELGRTEQTIRKHLKGESKAGQLVRETYELIKQGKLDEMLEKVEKMQLKQELAQAEYEKLLNDYAKLKEEYEKVKKEFEEIKEKIDLGKVEELKKELEKLKMENDILKNEIKDYKQKIENLEKENAELKRKNEEIKQKIEKLKKEFEVLLT